jgi:hypothetical protein
MKLGKLVDPQFQLTLRKLANQDMPLRAAFKLKGAIKRMQDELTKYEEVRSEGLKRLGDKKEDGSVITDENGQVRLSEENLALFAKEMDALLSTAIDIGSVSVAELGDKVSVSTADLLTLDSLLTE